MSSANDLAILLTKKIEGDLVTACFKERDHLLMQPNFYNIRQTILYTLREYIKFFFIEESISPEMLRNMDDNMVKSYRHHMTQKQAAMIGKEALEKNIADISEWNDEWDRFKKISTTLAFIDLKKLKDIK